VSNGVARVDRDGERFELLLKELPDKFVRWQLECKRSTYDAIERNDYIAFDAGHLPVVGTWPGDGLVPNLASKGVGFTPKDEYMDHYLERVESVVERISKLPPHATDATRGLRLAAARELYAHPEHIDWRRLGLLEIFEGSTFRNLVANPLASVLWSGNSPEFVSFQADCVVEIITPEDPRYRFPWAMRRLFEYEPFHVVQTMFPYAYCFWVHDWTDKTPEPRHPGSSKDDTAGHGPGPVG
jgi:hypothetical protein